MPRQVKVKILVAVDPQGAWSAAGWDDGKKKSARKQKQQDDRILDRAMEGVYLGEKIYVIEAFLDIPEPEVVEDFTVR